MIRIGSMLVGAAILFGNASIFAQDNSPTPAGEDRPTTSDNSVLADRSETDSPTNGNLQFYDEGEYAGSYPDGGTMAPDAGYGYPQNGYFGGYPDGGYTGSASYWGAPGWPNCGCGPHGCGHKGKPGGCYPRWYVEAEAIFLWRDNKAIFQPVVINSFTGDTILTTNSTDLDIGVGPRALIGVHLSQCAALELQYFSAFNFQGSASAVGSDDLATPGQLGLQGFDWSFADQMSIDYNSEIHNAELNYLHTWGRWSLITGFRYFRLTENYDLTAFNDFGTTSTTSFYNIDTRNDLYGAQLGGRYRHCWKRRWFWEATGKAGIFGNDASQSQLLTDLDDSDVLRNSSAKDSPVAFVGDVNISVGFLLSRVWSVRCGYNALWIDQVALGSDQLNFSLSPSAGTTINTSGSVFMQGINVGLEGRW